MPIYTYDCQTEACKNRFEYFHVRSDDHASCPKCSSKDVKKSEEPPKDTGFTLKGSGWAKDNYKTKKIR